MTGTIGQEGMYLADLLIRTGYDRHGVLRRLDISSASSIDHLPHDPSARATAFCDLRQTWARKQ